MKRYTLPTLAAIAVMVAGAAPQAAASETRVLDGPDGYTVELVCSPACPADADIKVEWTAIGNGSYEAELSCTPSSACSTLELSVPAPPAKVINRTVVRQRLIQPIVTINQPELKLSDSFLMGLRLQVGGFAGVPRTSHAGDGAGMSLLAGVTFRFPHVLTDWLGAEFTLSSGFAWFPGKHDVASANAVEPNLVFHLCDTVDLTLGYRFESLVDLDESLGHGHHVHLGVSYKISDRVSLGIDGYVGESIFVQRELHTEPSDDGGLTIDYKTTTHARKLSGEVFLSLLWWFWE